MNIKKEKQITIGGKKRMLKFGTNSTSIFCDVRDLSLIEAQSIKAGNMKPGEMRDLIYSGLAAGALKSGSGSIQDIGFTKWDVGDWIDELDQDTLQEIHDFMFDGSKKKSKDDR